MAVDLAKAPEETGASYMARLSNNFSKLHNGLASCKAENAELWNALEESEAQLALVAEKADRLNPLWVFLSTQFVITLTCWVEERTTEGKPYIVVPTAAVSAVGAILAYVTGHGVAGDVLLATLTGASAVLNVRYASKKGAEAAQAAREKKATEDAGKPADAKA